MRSRPMWMFFVCGLATLGPPASVHAQGLEDPPVVGLGDSLGEGVQSADASRRTQVSGYLTLLANQIGPPLQLPLIRTSPIGVVGSTLTRVRIDPTVEAANLAVAGADVGSLLRDRADAGTAAEIDSETDLVLFPALGSQIEILESLSPMLVVCWIGSNDSLSAALSFDQLDGSQLTPVGEFEADFTEIVQRLSARGALVVLANVPDVTNIGFLLDRSDLIDFVGSDFGLTEGSLTSAAAMLLIRLGLVDGYQLLQDPDFVLDANEIATIQNRTGLFNQIIADQAETAGMPVVDIHGLFQILADNPPTVFGVTLSPQFLGGLFSLDGVHPSNIGHAIIANAFIDTLNVQVGTTIPPIDGPALAEILRTDPFVDKDADGRVTGRFRAGLLETLGPLLGLSGDTNDFEPSRVPPAPDSTLGQRFQQRFDELRGPRTWNRAQVIAAFKEIFRTP